MSALAVHRSHSQKITKAVDKVLRQIFGEEATALIYKYLESNYSVGREEIPEKIELFSKALRELLSSGAYVVETKILEDIYSNYGIIREPRFEETEENFANQVKMICVFFRNENYC
jgi:hypothetical protein